MYLEFYIGKDTYVITESCILLNDEPIYTGKMKPTQILLGMPAFVEVRQIDSEMPLYLHTEKPVTSVLPSNEYYDGIPHPDKDVFELKFIQNSIAATLKLLAVNHTHVEALIKENQLGPIKLQSIKRLTEERGKTHA